MADDLNPEKLSQVHDFVDDDLLSCFLWAAGENAVAQPGWESPSVVPLKGIPLPPAMPPLPSAAMDAKPKMDAKASSSKSHKKGAAAAAKAALEMDDDGEGGLGLDDFDEGDIDDIAGAMGGPMSKEQKLTQRMQRKAESARVARLRKKEYVSGLEAEIAKLKGEVAALQAGGARPAAAAPAEPPTLREEGQRQLSQMDELLKRASTSSGPSLDKFVPEVNSTVEKYVTNKRAQQETINEYLDSIEDILFPGAPMQMAFQPNSIQQAALSAPPGQVVVGPGGGDPGRSLMSPGGPAAPAPPAPPAADNGDAPDSKRQRTDSVGTQLLQTLSHELGLTATQVEALSGQKGFISSDREIKTQCLGLIRELRKKVAEQITTSQSITDGLRRILTPVQVAKFLMWVEKNQTSMNMLNTMLRQDPSQ